MNDLRRTRQVAGISQFLAAQESGVSRMRLSLAETGQVALRPEEKLALRRVLRRALAAKRAALEEALVATS
jgi:transcriptional regulator with XRE-family HTH domain